MSAWVDLILTLSADTGIPLVWADEDSCDPGASDINRGELGTCCILYGDKHKSTGSQSYGRNDNGLSVSVEPRVMPVLSYVGHRDDGAIGNDHRSTSVVDLNGLPPALRKQHAPFG